MVLGLVFCATIAVVGVSGALYSYADDIRDYERAKYISAYKNSKVLDIEELGAKFLEQKPNASIRFLSVTNIKEDLKYIGVSVVENDKYGYYEINQYTGEIVTNNLKSDKFFTAVMMLHRFLSFKEINIIGKNIVAATTIAVIVLSISGFLLYLPRLKRNFIKSLRIEFKAKGYKFLYQLHSVLGVFTLIFVIIMCLTGLWWSYEWYRNFLSRLAGVENTGFARSTAQEFASGAAKELQRTVDMAKEEINGCKSYFIRVPFKDAPYELSYTNVRYGAYNLLKIDIQNERIVSRELYKDKTFGQKLIQNMYMLHSGQLFGETGKALWCVSSALMALFGISGAMMFYRRTKRKRGAKEFQPIK